MIADYVQEMTSQPDFGAWGRVLFGMIECDKDQYFKEKIMPVVEQFAPTVERFLVEGGHNHLFAGDTETWVDIFVAECFSRVQDFGDPHALRAYPHIEGLINRIHSVPAIKHYIQDRPHYPC